MLYPYFYNRTNYIFRKKYPYNCSSFNNLSEFLMPETIIVSFNLARLQIFDYLHILPFYNVFCRTTNIVNQLSSCPSVELEDAFYSVQCPLIDQAPQNDTTSLTTYTICVLL